MNGWTGNILDVDLSTGKIETRPLDMEQARFFVGGRGLGARMLWDLVGPGIRPLEPENVLIFATGPLTGTILDCNSGGFWGMQLKKSGHDVLIVRGKAAKPVWLEITMRTS